MYHNSIIGKSGVLGNGITRVFDITVGCCDKHDIRLSGEEVSHEIRIPRLGYLGDSTPRGLDDNPVMYETEILITELTFVSPSHRPEKIRKLGHIHLDHIVKRRERFQNKLIIAAHLSTRYHPRQVERFVKKALPDMLNDRLHLWL